MTQWAINDRLTQCRPIDSSPAAHLASRRRDLEPDCGQQFKCSWMKMEAAAQIELEGDEWSVRQTRHKKVESIFFIYSSLCMTQFDT